MVELKTLEAFNYGALEEFGIRDNHFEEDEQDGQYYIRIGSYNEIWT